MRLQLHTTGIEPVTYSLQILRHTMVAAIVQTRLYVFGRSIDFDFDRCRGQFVSTRPMPIPLNFGIAASLAACTTTLKSLNCTQYRTTVANCWRWRRSAHSHWWMVSSHRSRPLSDGSQQLTTRQVPDAMRAVHLPFAVETMGGLSESAQQLIRQIHHSAGDHNTRRDAAIIGTHLVDAVAIAVQRCTGMALQKSQWRERQVAMGAQAA